MQTPRFHSIPNCFLAVAALALPAAAQDAKVDFFFPPKAGIINVLDYGAQPNDGKDDTAAIQKALDAFPAGHKIIYLPNGVYHVTETLRWPQGENQGQNAKYLTLQGQSREGVTLQVPDGSPKFQDPKAPMAVIFTGGGPAQRFGNEVRDLTVNTGKGNPGAIGIQFNASNYGCMRNVRIVSGDGKGVIGLDMAYVGEVGPLLVKKLVVEGFDYGVKTKENEASQTLEDITLKNQNVAAFYNQHQSVFIHGLKTEGAVPAVWNDSHAGQVVLVDAVLQGTGEAAAGQPAVIQDAAAFAFLRNVKTSGFAMAIKAGDPAKNVAGPNVEEWPSAPVRSLFNSPGRSMNLPIKETPDVPLDRDLKNWADVRDFGAKAGDDADDTAAIQAAIDSGKATVWFPAATAGGEGTFKVNGTLHVRGNVSRIIGYSGVITGDGTVRFADGAAPVVVAERMAFGFFGNIKVDVATKRTVVLKDSSIDKGLTHTGSGELFIENVVVGKCTFQGGPVYARQLNPETPGVHVLVDGAQVWVLGMKVEVKGTILEVRNRGALEMLGLFVYASHVLDKSPMMIVDNAKLSISFREKTNFAESYPVIVRETRGDETREWVNAKGGGSAAPLFLAIPVKATAAPATPAGLRLRALSPSEVSVTWKDASGDEDGFRIERLAAKSKDWKTAGRAGIDASSFADHGLDVEADYQYRIVAYNSAGDSAPTEPGDVTTLRTTTAPAAAAGFVAATPAAGVVLLNWQDKSNNEEKFLVERQVNGGQWTEVASLPPDSATFTDTKLKPETTVAYRLSVVNKIGATPAGEQKVTTLPEGLAVEDFGAPQIAGQAAYDAAKKIYTLRAGGLEVWGKSDQFFFAFREMSGDITVTARVASFKDGEYYAKAGVMIRGTKALDSTHAFMSVGPGNLAYFSNRRVPAGDSAQDQGLDSGAETKWVRLVRSGNAVRGYYSKAAKPTEKDWTALGLPTPIDLKDPVLVGLVVVSQSDIKKATAVFEGFTIEPRAVVPVITEPTPPPQQAASAQAKPVPVASSAGVAPVLRSEPGTLPAGWASHDVNGPAVAGGATFDKAKNQFAVTGSGADIWGGMDQFQFTSRDVKGDFEIVTRIPYMQESGTFSKAGLMVRGSLDANAPIAFLAMKPDKQVNFTWRAAKGVAVEQSGWTGDIGKSWETRWMKLTRTGDSVSAFVSKDGKSWTPVGEPRTCALGPKAKVGLAVCATSLTATTLTLFADVAVTSGGAAAPAKK